MFVKVVYIYVQSCVNFFCTTLFTEIGMSPRFSVLAYDDANQKSVIKVFFKEELVITIKQYKATINIVAYMPWRTLWVDALLAMYHVMITTGCMFCVVVYRCNYLYS
jgi:hypothetical protein